MRRKKPDIPSGAKGNGQILEFPRLRKAAPARAKGDYKTVLLAQAMEMYEPFDEYKSGDGIPVFHKVLFNDATEFLLNLNVSLKACLYLDAQTIPKKLEFVKPPTENERATGALYHAVYEDGSDGLLYDYEIEGFFREYLAAIIIDIHNRFEEYEARYAVELATDGDFRIALAIIGATRTPMFKCTEQVDYPGY
ncbi:MAG: hypothetical protein IJS96_02565 [Schwartzia sp.]|nr:hypothetical protein [Schwartzia sp. (in: firmicutes)]